MNHKYSSKKLIALMLFFSYMISLLLFTACEVSDSNNTTFQAKQEEHTNDKLTTETEPIVIPNGPIDATPTTPQVTEPVTDTDPTQPDEGATPTSPTEPTSPIEPTTPTEPAEPTDPTVPTDPTEPQTPEETTPGPSDPPVTEPDNNVTLTYLEYYALSADEQQAFINSFESLDAFFAWHTAAKEAYEENRTPIDGSISMNP